MEFLLKMEEKLRELSSVTGQNKYPEVIDASERGILRIRSMREEYASSNYGVYDFKFSFL